MTKTIWDDIITHKAIKDSTKDSLESNILSFNETMQKFQVQRMKAGLAGGLKPDKNNKNRVADTQQEMLSIKDDLMEIAKFYTNSQ